MGPSGPHYPRTELDQYIFGKPENLLEEKLPGFEWDLKFPYASVKVDPSPNAIPEKQRIILPQNLPTQTSRGKRKHHEYVERGEGDSHAANKNRSWLRESGKDTQNRSQSHSDVPPEIFHRRSQLSEGCALLWLPFQWLSKALGLATRLVSYILRVTSFILRRIFWPLLVVIGAYSAYMLLFHTSFQTTMPNNFFDFSNIGASRWELGKWSNKWPEITWKGGLKQNAPLIETPLGGPTFALTYNEKYLSSLGEDTTPFRRVHDMYARLTSYAIDPTALMTTVKDLRTAELFFEYSPVRDLVSEEGAGLNTVIDKAEKLLGGAIESLKMLLNARMSSLVSSGLEELRNTLDGNPGKETFNIAILAAHEKIKALHQQAVETFQVLKNTQDQVPDFKKAVEESHVMLKEIARKKLNEAYARNNPISSSGILANFLSENKESNPNVWKKKFEMNVYEFACKSEHLDIVKRNLENFLKDLGGLGKLLASLENSFASDWDISRRTQEINKKVHEPALKELQEKAKLKTISIGRAMSKTNKISRVKFKDGCAGVKAAVSSAESDVKIGEL